MCRNALNSRVDAFPNYVCVCYKDLIREVVDPVSFLGLPGLYDPVGDVAGVVRSCVRTAREE